MVCARHVIPIVFFFFALSDPRPAVVRSRESDQQGILQREKRRTELQTAIDKHTNDKLTSKHVHTEGFKLRDMSFEFVAHRAISVGVRFDASLCFATDPDPVQARVSLLAVVTQNT